MGFKFLKQQKDKPERKIHTAEPDNVKKGVKKDKHGT